MKNKEESKTCQICFNPITIYDVERTISFSYDGEEISKTAHKICVELEYTELLKEFSDL